MKAFVSYSFTDSELYILTLLFEQLRKSGYTVDSSTHGFTIGQNFSDYKIISSDIFLGIVTNDSNSVNHVISEWNIAVKNNIRHILIIEDGVNIQNPNGLNYVRFNRQNPNQAIDTLFKMGNQSNHNKPKSPDVSDALVFGGIIVGIAALLSLLSGGGKK
jgi:hypothetical protein